MGNYSARLAGVTGTLSNIDGTTVTGWPVGRDLGGWGNKVRGRFRLFCTFGELAC